MCSSSDVTPHTLQRRVKLPLATRSAAAEARYGLFALPTSLARLAGSRQAYVLLLLLSFFFLFFFNDRLEQRDLGNYQIDLHQIFRVGIDMLV